MTDDDMAGRAAEAVHAVRLAEIEASPPLFWPRLSGPEAEEEWPALFEWVEGLRHRYPNSTRLPDCWFRHNDLVEALAALRDYERGCFGAKAPPTAAVDWQRAFREIEQRLELWIRRSPCGVSDRGHITPHQPATYPDGWQQFVIDDLRSRAASEVD